jgi:hypothetical protein
VLERVRLPYEALKRRMNDEGRRMNQKSVRLYSAFCLLPFLFGCVAERRLRQTVDLESPDETDGGSSPSAPMVYFEHDADGRRLGCKPGFLQVRLLSCSLKILEALTPLARGLVPKTRGPLSAWQVRLLQLPLE